jgi:cytochrome c biogenesis protein
MMRGLQWLGSTRFTLLGMALLAMGAALSYDNPVTTPVWVLVVPLLLLALNLLLAIIINPAINRRPGLLLFHIGLLSVVILVALGRLTFMEAHIELVDGAAFDREALFDVRQGPWHSGDLEQVRFIQQGYRIDYRPAMKRGLTYNQILVADADGRMQSRTIGDDRPLLVEGYRLYTTSNKGFAPRLTWVADDGASVSGSINMPSYPLLYFRQTNEWTPPGGPAIKFWLQLNAGLKEDAAWVLQPEQATGTLVINQSGQRVELQPGESLALAGGTLHYDQLSGWMGFKLFYDPTLPWLFISAILAVLGLFIHYWQKFAAEPLLLKA